MARRPVSRPQTIELDELLHGNPSWEDVVQFWRHGDFPEESYSIAAIEKHLQTEEQRRAIFDRKLSIEKMLNGRYGGDDEAFVESIYDAWNKKLGFYQFGGGLGYKRGQPYQRFQSGDEVEWDAASGTVITGTIIDIFDKTPTKNTHLAESSYLITSAAFPVGPMAVGMGSKSLRPRSKKGA